MSSDICPSLAARRGSCPLPGPGPGHTSPVREARSPVGALTSAASSRSVRPDEDRSPFSLLRAGCASTQGDDLVLDRRPGRPHSPGAGRVGPHLGWGSVTAPDPTRPVDVLTVTSVCDVTPSVRRIVFSGTPTAVVAAGPTISLLVPRVGDPAPRWPSVQRDGRIVWPEGAHGVSLRSYTARRQEPDRGGVEIDFVLHGDGPAATWAGAAGPGTTVAVAGGGPLGDRPAGWLLLAGDETDR